MRKTLGPTKKRQPLTTGGTGPGRKGKGNSSQANAQPLTRTTKGRKAPAKEPKPKATKKTQSPKKVAPDKSAKVPKPKAAPKTPKKTPKPPNERKPTEKTKRKSLKDDPANKPSPPKKKEPEKKRNKPTVKDQMDVVIRVNKAKPKVMAKVEDKVALVSGKISKKLPKSSAGIKKEIIKQLAEKVDNKFEGVMNTLLEVALVSKKILPKKAALGDKASNKKIKKGKEIDGPIKDEPIEVISDKKDFEVRPKVDKSLDKNDLVLKPEVKKGRKKNEVKKEKDATKGAVNKKNKKEIIKEEENPEPIKDKEDVKPKEEIKVKEDPKIKSEEKSPVEPKTKNGPKGKKPKETKAKPKEEKVKPEKKADNKTKKESASAATKKPQKAKPVKKAVKRNEAKKESDDSESEPKSKRAKTLPSWGTPKRHRVASLNAIAKVHCLYENESRGAMMEVLDKSLVLRKDSPIEKKEPEVATRALRTAPGLRGAGKHWDILNATSSSSSEETSDSGTDHRQPTPKKAPERVPVPKPRSTSPSSRKSDESKVALEEIKKVRRRKRRKRSEIVMDLKDMVVRKRMASLNASAMLAATYSVEKKTTSSQDEGSKRRRSSSDSSSSPEPGDTSEDEVISRKKVSLIVNQDTDVTITGVYVNSTTRSTRHEGYCSISGMQYRISSTSHTQTETTAVSTETVIHTQHLQDGASPVDSGPGPSPALESAGPSDLSCKSYTPLGALSSMQPPGDSRRHLPPPPTIQCSTSAFSAPPYHHPHPHPQEIHGYYQPAGPLISHHGPASGPTGPPLGGPQPAASSSAASAKPASPPGPLVSHPYPPPPAPYYSYPLPTYPHSDCYTYSPYPPHPATKYHAPPGHPAHPAYRRPYSYYPPPGVPPPPQEYHHPPEPPSQMVTSQGGPPLVDPYPPPPPAPPHPSYYPYSGAPPMPPGPCYSHPTSTRGLASYIDPTYSSCPCPMNSACPKNVHTGPLTGDSKGPSKPSTAPVPKQLPPVALALPLEPNSTAGPPSPARGSAGMPQAPSPALATARNPPSQWTPQGLLTTADSLHSLPLQEPQDLDQAAPTLAPELPKTRKRRRTLSPSTSPPPPLSPHPSDECTSLPVPPHWIKTEALPLSEHPSNAPRPAPIVKRKLSSEPENLEPLKHRCTSTLSRKRSTSTENLPSKKSKDVVLEEPPQITEPPPKLLNSICPKSSKKHFEDKTKCLLTPKKEEQLPAEIVIIEEKKQISTGNVVQNCTVEEKPKKGKRAKTLCEKINGIRIKKEMPVKSAKGCKEGKNHTAKRTKDVSSALSLSKCTPSLRWSNGWSWEGEPYTAKVYLASDDLPVVRKCFPAMRHIEGDLIQPRDCVLLKAGPRKQSLPYVAKISAMWENPDDGEMMVSLLWYYRPEHTEQGRLPGQPPDEIFASRHKDINSVACIEDKCYVLTFNEYCRYHKSVRYLQDPNGCTRSVVPSLESPYPRAHRLPPGQVAPDLVFFCRKVYDFRQRRILKNPNF